METLQRYYPNIGEIVAAHHLVPRDLIWGRTIWSIEKAKRLLGYQPQYNFDGFLRALSAGNHEYYPVRGTPWWGV